jgi:hypothetical protein
LDGAVKPFDVSVVVAFADSAVTQGDAFAFEHVMKPLAKLSTIVCLEHLYGNAKVVLSAHGDGECRSLVELRCVFGIGAREYRSIIVTT